MSNKRGALQLIQHSPLLLKYVNKEKRPRSGPLPYFFKNAYYYVTSVVGVFGLEINSNTPGTTVYVPTIFHVTLETDTVKLI